MIKTTTKWMLTMFALMVCAVAMLADPMQAKAAERTTMQSEADAYRAVFDAEYYYNTNPDVAAAYGMDEEALLQHFMVFGVYEGRSASAEFNPQAYRQRYADLQEAFGNNMSAYCRHYIEYGRAEGRNASYDGRFTVNQADSSPSEKKTEQKTEKQDKTEKQTDTAKAEETGERQQEVQASAAQLKQVAENIRQQKAIINSDSGKLSGTGTDTQKKETIAAKKKSDSADMAVSISAQDIETTKSALQKITQIGSYTTEYDATVERATNVQLAAERINCIVVEPGEAFSFSKAILERTQENGYVNGPVFVNGKETVGIGGGVCQVSSTLYAAMVAADLPATEHHSHSLEVDYVPEGLDATIAGDYYDLKFINTFSQPLLIQASAVNGILTVSLSLK